VIDAGGELRRGLLWFGSATLLMRLLDLGATLIILQVLSREEMGIAALAWSVVVICEALNGLGVGTALVQAKELSQRQLDSLFWFACGVGVGLGGLMAAIGPAIAAFYDTPVLTSMIGVSALKLVFVGAALVPLQLLARDLRFRGSGVVQTGATALEAISKVALALSGAGAWALVLSNAARGLYVLALVYMLAPFWPRRHFALDEVRPLLRFGARATLSATLFHTYRNADYFFVGRYLGLEALGVYRVAFSLAMTPLEVAMGVVNRVTFPVYARIANDGRMLADAFMRSFRYVLLVLEPIVVLLYFTAEDAVALVAHERWLAAVPAIQVLCWAALLRGLAQLFAPLFQAAGRPEYAVYEAVVSAIVLVSGFWLALERYGGSLSIMSVCIVWIAAYPLLVAIDLLWARRITGIAPRALIANALPVLGGLAAMAPPLYLSASLRAYGLDPAAMLAVEIALGLTAYALYLRFVLGLRLQDLRARSVHGSVES
jgi:O-antigen/teichoic acid export membrane protein